MLLALSFPAWISPEVIPGFPLLRWYGLMYLVAFTVSYLLFRVQVKERGMDVDPDELMNLFFWAIVGLIVGARLFAVTVYDADGYYMRNPLQIIWPFARVGGRLRFTGIQGMSYHGGLVGVIVGFFIYCRMRKIDALEWGDIIVTGIPLGYFFGRVGNFINAELYGRITGLPWGMVFPGAERVPADEPWSIEVAAAHGIDLAGKAAVNLPRHPSQLYEAFGEGILLWLILWFGFRKRRPFKGFSIAVYMIGYGVVRFFIEYARQPDRGIDFPIKLVAGENPGYVFLSPWAFTTGQILCLLMILGGVVAFYLFRRQDLARRRATAEGEEKRRSAKRRRRMK